MATAKDNSAYEATKAAADEAYEEFAKYREAFNEHWKEAKENASKMEETAAGKAGDAYDETKNNVGKAEEAVAHAVHSLVEGAKGAVLIAEEAVADVAHNLYEEAKGVVDWATGTAEAAADGVKGAAQGLADSEPVSIYPSNICDIDELSPPGKPDKSMFEGKATKEAVGKAGEALSDMAK